MTPFNIVNMAKLLGFDIIALTDHNSAGNCMSAIAAGEQIGLTVIPGMELSTAEEIHTVCLFPDMPAIDAFSRIVRESLPPIKNKPDVFGCQLLMDEADGILGEEENLLIAASSITIDDLPALCREYGGFCYPAHIDRSSFSILSNLGFITADMGFSCAEVSPHGNLVALTSSNPDLARMRIIQSSDAHYLENMTEPMDRIEADECTAKAVIKALMQLNH